MDLIRHFQKHATSWRNCVRDFSEFLSHDVYHECEINRPKTRKVVKSFNESSVRTQQRRTKELLDGTSPNLMRNAAASAINIENPGFKKIFKSSQELNLSLTSKLYFNYFHNIHLLQGQNEEKKPKIAAENALKLMHKISLSRSDFEYLNSFLGEHLGMKPLPNYKKLAEIKSKCYPENMVITETEFRADPIELCKHTIKRIAENFSKNQSLLVSNDEIFEFRFKYGNIIYIIISLL